MDTLRVLGFLTLWCCVLAALRIKEFQVPAQLPYGNVTSVILECKYEVDDPAETENLVVKWFFKDTHLVYQWINGQEPQVGSMFKDILDLDYSIFANADGKHGALKITNITPELTGEYKCTVWNNNNEDSRSQKMIIYDEPDVFHLESFENSSMLLCSAFDAYPKPTLSVYSTNVNLTELTEEDYIEGDNEDDDTHANEVDSALNEVEDAYGYYNVTKSFRYDPSDLTEETEIICELKIPDTNYRRVLRRLVKPEGETTSTTETYDYETTTMTTTNSPITTEREATSTIETYDYETTTMTTTNSLIATEGETTSTTETYDYETTTMTTTNFPIVTVNLALIPRSSKPLLSMIAFAYLWRHL